MSMKFKSSATSVKSWLPVQVSHDSFVSDYWWLAMKLFTNGYLAKGQYNSQDKVTARSVMNLQNIYYRTRVFTWPALRSCWTFFFYLTILFLGSNLLSSWLAASAFSQQMKIGRRTCTRTFYQTFGQKCMWIISLPTSVWTVYACLQLLGDDACWLLKDSPAPFRGKASDQFADIIIFRVLVRVLRTAKISAVAICIEK